MGRPNVKTMDGKTMTTTNNNTGNYKWLLLMFLWAAFFLHQGTRQIYNAILPQIQGAFGVDSLKMGIVGTVFTMTYGICAPLSGLASDFLSRKYMVVAGLFIFCAGIFVSGWATCIGMMIVFYGLLNGAGQAFYYPAACSLLSQLHDDTRATALSIHQTALYAGIVICSCVSGYFGDIPSVGDFDGWRMPFVLFGGTGILWAAVLAVAMRNTKPAQAQGGAAQKASFKDAFFVMFRKPSAILLAFGMGMHIYVDCGFKTWMPAFLHDRFALDGAQAAFNAVIWHYIGACLGVMLGGKVSDYFAKARKTARFETNIIGLVLASPFIFLTANAGAQALCFAAMLAFGFFRGVYDSNMFASLFDVVAPRYRSAAMGLYLSGAFFLGCPATWALGKVGEHFSLQAGMAIFAVTYALGAVAIFLARGVFYARDKVD